MEIWKQLQRKMQSYEAKHLLRSLRGVPEGAVDLASNDYLGLATHPEVIEAAREAAAKFGTGARASRLVSGNYELVEELEAALARFKGCEAALVYSSGYAANLGLITALSAAFPNRAIFSHKRNHASIRDACVLASWDGRVRYFRDLERLRVQLQEEDEKQKKALVNAPGLLANTKLIIVDGVFSMDGDVCHLPAILALARESDALILLDDAHGTGTLGATGRGTCEHFGIHDERIIQIGTLSKALGSQGGFVAGPRVLIDYLVNASRSFIYSTGINPPAVGAALKALEIVERESERVQKCHANAKVLAKSLQNLGFDARLQPSPILPIMVQDEKSALDLSAHLNQEGFWCPAIRPPTVPTARLRLTSKATWTAEQLNQIAAAFGSFIDR